MFDVIWTDPNRELVGEHRARKASERSQKDRSSKPSSLSTKRSSLSSTGSRFSFLRSHSLKRTSTSDTNYKSTQSPLSTSFEAGSRKSSGLANTCSTGDPASTAKLSVDRVQSPDLSQHAEPDSILSTYEERHVKPSQSNGQGSPSEHGRRSQDQANNFVSKKPVKSLPVPIEKFSVRQSAHTDGLNSHDYATWPRLSGNLIRPTNKPESSDPFVLVPGPLTATRVPGHFQLNNPLARHYTNQWTASSESRDLTIDTVVHMPSEPKISGQSGIDIQDWKLEIQRMSLTGLKDIVSRLKLICGLESKQDSGATHEAESVIWMLWALTELDPTPSHDSSVPTVQNLWRKDPGSVLGIYEPRDITSYLVALYSTSQIYHLSPTPLPAIFSSNIHPLTVPSVHSSDFPPSKSQHDTVISLSLPSVSPAVDIPPILSKISSCLRPGGTLRLLIINPLPCAGTFGHHMHSWLCNHLLANLDRTFRCANPAKLFPGWLANASLRGDGSTITKTRFFANPASARLYAAPDVAMNYSMSDLPFKPTQSELVAKAEARSLAGRLLWKHIWGPFVTSDKCWWDDPMCISECLALGTLWEYQIINAVKDGGSTA